ncbi:unnamed protein product [Linum trigynum]|uniref:Uncharacterized protein n=1 Tax=Linum trigynum TaxID=586398 RepID=A0AAV2FV38_9ROSI
MYDFDSGGRGYSRIRGGDQGAMITGWVAEDPPDIRGYELGGRGMELEWRIWPADSGLIYCWSSAIKALDGGSRRILPFTPARMLGATTKNQ